MSKKILVGHEIGGVRQVLPPLIRLPDCVVKVVLEWKIIYFLSCFFVELKETMESDLIAFENDYFKGSVNLLNLFWDFLIISVWFLG